MRAFPVRGKQRGASFVEFAVSTALIGIVVGALLAPNVSALPSANSSQLRRNPDMLAACLVARLIASLRFWRG